MYFIETTERRRTLTPGPHPWEGGVKKKKNQTLFWRGSCCFRPYFLYIEQKGWEIPPTHTPQQPVLKVNHWRNDSNAFFPIENRSYCNAFKYMQMIHAVSGLANLDYNINYPSKSAFVLNLSLDYNSNWFYFIVNIVNDKNRVVLQLFLLSGRRQLEF